MKLKKIEYAKELKKLEQEHLELNEIIDEAILNKNLSEFTLQKVKRRKLYLKDKIEHLKSLIYPDIIA